MPPDSPRVATETIAEAFQVDAGNALAGLDGRVALLHALGEALRASPALFGDAPARPGGLFDHLTASGTTVFLRDVLHAVLRALGSIWPGRIIMDGISLGDVWRHRAVMRPDATRGLVPFHKLSQWLTYSLVEPMLDAGVEVTGIDALTGLAEYRNGGLFVDLDVLALRDTLRGGRLRSPSTRSSSSSGARSPWPCSIAWRRSCGNASGWRTPRLPW